VTGLLDTSEPRWLPPAELRAAGFIPGGPEIDYGMNWGDSGAVRVSYAPRAGEGPGFLYAHDSRADRYLLLAPATTERQVDAAWRELQPFLGVPDAYLALASVAHRELPMPVDRARDLLVHCVDRELAVLRDLRAADIEAPTGFETARALMIQRSARVSAEQLLRDAASVDAEPVLVRYRVPQDRTWSGVIADISVDRAAATTRAIADLAGQRGVEVQATSVTHGWSTIAAARVPQLEFAARRQAVAIDAPQLTI